jgi:hypothetical protein
VIFFDDVLNDRPEITVLPLETALILRNEALKMVEQDPVEDGSLRSARTIDSRYIGKDETRIGPGSKAGRKPCSARETKDGNARGSSG